MIPIAKVKCTEIHTCTDTQSNLCAAFAISDRFADSCISVYFSNSLLPECYQITLKSKTQLPVFGALLSLMLRRFGHLF